MGKLPETIDFYYGLALGGFAKAKFLLDPNIMLLASDKG
jgi:hypothetical protein